MADIKNLNRYVMLDLMIGLIACHLLSFCLLGSCLVVILGFPALIFLASKSELKGIFSLVGSRLGDMSYLVYLFQTPAMLFTAAASQILLGKKIAEFAPISGMLFIVGLLGVSYLSWRYFELPSRNFIRQKLSTVRLKIMGNSSDGTK